MTQRHRQIPFAPQQAPTEVERRAIDENSGEAFSFSEKLEVYENYEPDRKPWDVDAPTRGLAEVCLVLFNSNEFLYVP
jgi:hypothetical protein